MAEILFEDPADAEDESAKLSVLVQDIIAGGIAGSAGIFAGHPLDTLKVRLQLPSSKNQGVPKGHSGLFRGLAAPLSTAALVNATSFTTVRLSCRIWDKHYSYEDHPDNRNIFSVHRTIRNFNSGFIAGLLSSFWLAPSEHVKVRLQASSSLTAQPIYRGSIHAAQQILHSHGISGLYRGMTATCLRQAPGFGVYFAVYEPVKEYFLQNGEQSIYFSSILAGGFAGSLSWAVIYPIDVIKSRVQTAPLDAPWSQRSMAAITRRIFEINGGRSLYRGVVLTVIRAFPVNAIIFSVYELSLEHLFSRHHL